MAIINLKKKKDKDNFRGSMANITQASGKMEKNTEEAFGGLKKETVISESGNVALLKDKESIRLITIKNMKASLKTF
jgi:hypothetical protein